MRRQLSVLLLLLFAVVIVGCTTSNAPGATTIDITIADGSVTPNGERIEVGLNSEVTLNITSDVPEVLHVHGYELQIDVPADTPVTRTFTADKPGTYEVETHESVIIVAKLVVR